MNDSILVISCKMESPMSNDCNHIDPLQDDNITWATLSDVGKLDNVAL